MSAYPDLRQRFLQRLPETDPEMAVAMLRVCVYIGNHGDSQAAVLGLIGDGCQVAVVEDLMIWLEAHCGDLLAELRTVLDVDKAIAALAGVGFQPVLDKLHREFFAA